MQPAGRLVLTCLITSSFSITLNVSMVGTVCCRRLILKDRKNGSPRVSKKLGAIQIDFVHQVASLRDAVQNSADLSSGVLADDLSNYTG